MLIQKTVKKEIISSFKTLNNEEKYDLLSSLILSMNKKQHNIPLSIFNNKKLTIPEAVIKYLKENLGMKYVDIAFHLKRSDKTVWLTYHKSKDKLKRFSEIRNGSVIPIEIFSNRTLTLFESLVYYLKKNGMKNHEIAIRLNRDDRTIWSVYNNAKKKNG